MLLLNLLLLLLDLTSGFSQQHEQQQLQKRDKYVYIACYKPALTLCSLTSDKERAIRKGRDIRQTLFDLSLPENLKNDLHIVGRLDRDSEGLLLLTNDGQFTSQVLSENCHKTYWALTRGNNYKNNNNKMKNRNGSTTTTNNNKGQVVVVEEEKEKDYPPSEIALNEMRKGGLEIRGAKTRPPIAVNILKNHHQQQQQQQHSSITEILPKPALGMDRGSTWLEVTLNEGRNRQVRKITACSGHKTVRLCRIAIGKFSLQNHQDLLERPGNWKFINKEDVLF